MPNLINLVGQNFGNYIVKEKLPSKNGKTYWLCECSKCHSTKEIQGTHLRNNNFKNCCEIKEKEKRQCLICGKSFFLKDKGYARKYCYDCSPSQSEVSRSAVITQIRHSIKKQLVDYKGGKCEKCGYNKCLGALQFHHINPEEKDFEITTKYKEGFYDMQEMYKEVDKCKLLCANCHAEEHFNQ